MIRAFFAIPVDDESFTDALKQWFAATLCDQRASFVSPSRWHITVKFFDAIEPESLARLGSEARMLVETMPQLQLEVKKIDSFPRADSPIIAAIIKPNRLLRRLHMDLDKAAARLGYRPELRRFRPHITLAKKHPAPWRCSAVLPYQNITLCATKLMLYESRRHTGVYVPLRTFSFKQAGETDV